MRSLAVMLALVGACEAPAGPKVEARPAALEGESTTRLREASTLLRTQGCVPEALAVVRALHEAHGDAPALVEAQRVAFEACNDPEALAQLLARTMPAEAPASARLELGAAWVRAASYADAVKVLEPLAREEGPASQAAWLTGFALFHAGEQERALPLLVSARQHAAKNVSDAWLLIGLAKLETGDLPGAVAELEAGTEVFADDPLLWTALVRAYTVADRPADAARAEAQASTTRTARADALRSQIWLAARAMELRNAADAQDVAAVERAFDGMWDAAPTDLRRQMLELRAGVYAKARRSERTQALRESP